MSFDPPRDIAAAFGRCESRALTILDAGEPAGETAKVEPAIAAKRAKWRAAGAAGLALLAAGAFVMTISPGILSSYSQATATRPDPVAELARSVETMRGEDEARRADLSKKLEAAAPASDVALLKSEVEGLKDTLKTARSEAAQKIAAMTARLDNPKTETDIAELRARIDQVAQDRAPDAAAVEPVVSTASIPTVGHQGLKGWIVRDVYQGVALIDGEQGMIQVAAGENAPGVGKIRSIEKRGRQWVVVADAGEILEN